MMNPYLPAVAADDRNYYYKFSLCEYDEIPIVFIATDDDKNLYLCECTDMRFGTQTWTIAATTEKTIRELIDQRVTLYEALRRRGNSIDLVRCDLSTKHFFHTRTTFDQLTEENLPEQDSMVWINNDQIDEDFRRLILESKCTSNQSATITYEDRGIYSGIREGSASIPRTNVYSSFYHVTTTISFDYSFNYTDSSGNNSDGVKAA